MTTDTKPMLIEVMSPHCVECRAMQPDLDAVAEEHRGSVDLIVLDASAEPDRTADLKVFGTPTLIAMQNGTEVARFTGRRSRRELNQLFEAMADGDPGTVNTVSRGDRIVWSVAAVLLAVAGLLSGPSWILVGLSVGLGGFALFRSGGS